MANECVCVCVCQLKRAKLIDKTIHINNGALVDKPRPNYFETESEGKSDQTRNIRPSIVAFALHLQQGPITKTDKQKITFRLGIEQFYLQNNLFTTILIVITKNMLMPHRIMLDLMASELASVPVVDVSLHVSLNDLYVQNVYCKLNKQMDVIQYGSVYVESILHYA